MKDTVKQKMGRWQYCMLLVLLGIASCKHEPFVTPNTDTGGGTGPGGTICFESDVLPIFISSCAKSGCHNASSAEEGYVLDSYNNIVRKGVKAGNASGSKIYEVLLKSGSDRMPEPPNPALTADQIKLIAAWINEGAKNTTNCTTTSCDTSAVTYSKTIAPIITNNCVSCHSASLANGGYNFSAYAGVKSAIDNKRLIGAIYYQSGFSGMPQGYHLTDCQVATIKKWVYAGALNN